jgi:hypothetical protein
MRGHFRARQFGSALPLSTQIGCAPLPALPRLHCEAAANRCQGRKEIVFVSGVATLSSLAKVEAQKISERTKAGLARARAKGKQIGIAADLDAAARASLSGDAGIVKTAKALRRGHGTVQGSKPRSPPRPARYVKPECQHSGHAWFDTVKIT